MIIAIADLKFVKAFWPAVKMIGDILDFSVLDVPIWIQLSVM